MPVDEDVQLDGVRDGSHDMALVRLPVERDGLHLIPLYEEQPVVVIGIEHDATVVDEVTMDDLADDEFVDWRTVRHLRRGRDGRPTAPASSRCRCRWPGCTPART